jgi:hypothetical protein
VGNNVAVLFESLDSTAFSSFFVDIKGDLQRELQISPVEILFLTLLKTQFHSF